MTNKPILFAFLNAYTQGLSGSDKVFLENFKKINFFQLKIITSFLGKKLCQKNKLKADYFITSKEKSLKNLVMLYCQRTIKAIKLGFALPFPHFILSTSDALPDVLPAYLIKKKYPKAKWVQHVFHLINEKKRLSFWGQKISLKLIKKADLIIVDNKLLKKQLIFLGFKAKKIAINYLGVNKKLFGFKAKEKKPQAVFMAQLRSSKGINFLIPLWQKVIKKAPWVKLFIIGTGQEKIRKKLKKQIKFNQLEKNIKLLGFISNKKKVKILSQSQVFICLSKEEGFGLALAEAQALGLPIVSWDLPVFKEIFSQGIIKIKPYNINAFAHKIIKLLTNKNYWQKLTQEAKNNARQYCWNKTRQKQIKLLKKLL